jgi:hypothetical protein
VNNIYTPEEALIVLDYAIENYREEVISTRYLAIHDWHTGRILGMIRGLQYANVLSPETGNLLYEIIVAWSNQK